MRSDVRDLLLYLAAAVLAIAVAGAAVVALFSLGRAVF